MTIGIISDTHGWVPQAALTALAGVDLILHAGDVGDPAVIDTLRAVAPVHAVGGNCDQAGAYPTAFDAELAGVRIHMSHGHEVDPKGWFLKAETLAARYPAADIVVFGHTHRMLIKEVGQTLVINPGAVAANQKVPTVVRLDLPSRTVQILKLAVQK